MVIYFKVKATCFCEPLLEQPQSPMMASNASRDRYFANMLETPLA